MSRRFIALILLMVFLSGCATVPRPAPQAEAKLVEANAALDAVNEQSSAFYAQLGPLVQEIEQFCKQPGWNEFEQILLEYPSLRDSDNEIEITPEIESRFQEWTRKWKTPWEGTLTGYHDLVDKCLILDAKRLAARERLLVVQAKFLAAVLMETSAGREKEGKEIYSVVETLDKTGTELNSYQVDDLGLFRNK